jgi:predicted DnaQ family exonuclease/DinG family helicase
MGGNSVLPDFVAIDVETTGLTFASDRIIEIGAVKFKNGIPGETFSSLVNPGIPVPQVITELTGITNDEAAKARPFGEIAAALNEFIGTLPLCGHQIEFDLTFLNKEMEQAGHPSIGKQSLDTVLLARILLEPGSRYSLKTVSESLGIMLENAHRALDDARASGEIACILVPRLAELPDHVLQTIAAAAPASFFKTLVFKSLGQLRPLVSIRPHNDLPSCSRLTVPEKIAEIDIEDIRDIFSAHGPLEKQMGTFSPRKSQLDMALAVTKALNSQSFLVAEAGTGTGKSLAYLVPASLWAQKNNTRILVASRTKNLQDQLISKELPIISKTIGKKFRYSILKGRGNYLCLNRFEHLLLGEYGNLSQRERFAILPLIPWIDTTKTGDIEEQNQFNPKWFKKIWDLIASESHGCSGKRCPFFQDCFLQQARQKALTSHIVVINHALFFSEMCAGTSFLGKIGSIVFDEAHHLESSGHMHLRVEVDTNRINLYIEDLNNLTHLFASAKNENAVVEAAKEVKSLVKQLRKISQQAFESINNWIITNNSNAGSSKEYQITIKEGDLSGIPELATLNKALGGFKELAHSIKQSLSNSYAADKTFEGLQEVLVSSLERTTQLSADLNYLVAAKTEDHAFWIEGDLKKGWVKLCGVPLDVADLLSGIWESNSSLVFTSATLSVAGSSNYFTDSVGLAKFPERTVVSFFPSPFRSSQAIRGAIKNSPDPDSPEYPLYITSVISDLHVSLKKNILVLFTANSMLDTVHRLLKSDTRIQHQSLLAQGSGTGRHVLLEQFKKGQGMILLGADSFWEGIDAPGETCEIVIVARLPFPVPSHPLNLAIQKKMEKIHGESFLSFSVPEAIIRFRQGCGRLIRTTTDKGALLVLDNRIINKGYGKRFIRSIEGDFKFFENPADMLSHVKSFFADMSDIGSSSRISYVQLDEVEYNG